MKRTPRARRQSGIALITAILVVSLAAIAAAAMLTSANIAIRRTENLQNSELAWWYADGVESWIKSILERDVENNKFDSLQDIWAQPIDYLPLDEGALRGRVVDLQSLYNLNNLAADDPQDPNYASRQLAVFIRLLTYTEIADSSSAQALAARIRDWIDADIEPTGYDGAEDSAYLRVALPYRTANRLMSSPSELLAIQGMTREIYQKLRPLVCTLPQIGTPINVNTAPALLLQAMANESRPALDEFVEKRLEQPVENDQSAATLFAAEDPGSDMASASSQFFMSEVEIAIGSNRLSLYSFYFRPDAGIPAVYGRSTDTE